MLHFIISIDRRGRGTGCRRRGWMSEEVAGKRGGRRRGQGQLDIPHGTYMRDNLSHSKDIAPTSMNMVDHGIIEVMNVLLAFKKRIISDPNGVLANWNSSNPCNWRGVSCSHGPTSRVEKLHLAEGNLTGALAGELGQLRYLIDLNLSSNKFTGPISSEIAKLRNLTVLDLSQNQLHGNIPLELLTSLEKLAVMRLDNNRFNGSIPSQLGQLRELLHLNLSSNQLSGKIPMELGQLKKLEVLDLSQNRLSGRIPFELGQLRMLSRLILFSNNLSGKIPPEIGQLAESLQALIAHNNRISGSISPQLGQLKKLEILKLGNNSISSELPSELGMLANLEILDVKQNNLTGNIPNFVANLSRLNYLDMSCNQLSGVVPPFLANCSMLQYVKLDRNLLVGEVPAEIGHLKHLHSLSIATNNLTRVHPALSFSNRSSVVLIDFCFNNLTGALPASWGQNKNLRVFTVAYNNLEGNLPNWLWDLHNLQLLDFSNNKFTGRISAKIGSLQALRKSNTQYEPETLWNDEIILNFKGTLLFYSYFFSTQAFLDLSGNRLSGQIPSEIGFLNCLRNLNLSANRLSGHIPQTLGNLTLLESLDLSTNLLDGQIPRELTNIASLSVLNVSYNNLSGAVPGGRQFNTFTNSSYLGNNYLYGFPLWRSSRDGDRIELIKVHDRKLSGVAIILIGLLAGAILVCIVALWCYCFYRTRACHSCVHENPEIRSFGEGLKLNLSELSDATNGFSEAAIIGTGALSKVYKGILNDGKVIAIKILQVACNESLCSFVMEREILGKIRHRNLVKLLGSFSDSKTKALLLQFMPNGSLETHLHRSDEVCQLTWEARYKIATGIAQAIVYLHSETGMGQIVHCDLKPSNVLIDEDMEAHICDFGIARMIDSQITETAAISATLRGSIGYIAPEFANGGRISAKADVYSYGVLLLEIITRRSPTCGFPPGFNSLAEWVRWSLKEETFPVNMKEVIDPCVSQAIHPGEVASAAYQYSLMEEIVAVLRLGVMCCRNDPKERPAMNVVLFMLHNIKKKPQAW